MNILRLALTGLFRKKFYTLLLFAVCFAAMQTVLSGITGAAGFFYQQKIFEASVSVELDRVLHLDYQYTEETPEFAGVIRQYLDYIGTLPGMAAVGQFDAEGVYFSELKDLEAYKSVNGALLKGQTYEDYPGISRLLHADAAMLPFVEGGVTGYADPGNGSLPLYVSEVFREILPIGQTLTEERTGERYEVMGYIPKGAVWVEEDDLIRFPVVSLDGWFLAPFSGQSRSDIMTQLSCLHNTYVFLADGADTGLIREQIAAYPRQHGFAASARLLSEEYGDYLAETGAFTTRQVLLAGFITVMAVSSVTAVFAVSALLKRQQYGIWMACGFSRSAVAAEILLELFMVLLGAGLLAWGVQWVGLMRSTDLFRGVLLRAHTGCTLPACILLAVLITGMGALIPLNRLFRTSPGELIKGGTDTID